MEPFVSIIIGVKNAEEVLEACLQSLKKQTYKNIEIIVVDNHSKDKTASIAKQYTNLVFTKGPERSAQRNFGVKKSHGEYVLILDADMQLSRNVVKECVKIVIKNKKILAVVIPEESFGVGFWAQCKKLERSFYVENKDYEAARFFNKATFDELKGYDEDNTGTEDYDLPQRLAYSFGQNKISNIKAYIYHNEGELSLSKTMYKKYYYAQKLSSYAKKKENKKQFKTQANLFARYKLFFSHPKKLFSNPLLGIGMLFMKTSEFLAGGIGYMKGKYLNSFSLLIYHKEK